MKRSILTVVLSCLASALLSTTALADTLRLTTGMVGGTYHDVLGVNLRNVMRERGINTEVLQSKGSAENLERIASGDADVGFTQADALARWLRTNPTADIEILGSLGQECVFMATGGETGLDRFSKVNDSSHRIAVGEQGSGSALSAEYIRMLSDNFGETQTFYQGGMRAMAQVQTGQLDGFIWVTSPENKSHRFFETVISSEESLQFVNFDVDNLTDKLPNGQEVYEMTEITLSEGWFFDETIRSPCTGLMVIGAYDLDSHVLEELAYVAMSNSSRIRGQ